MKIFIRQYLEGSKKVDEPIISEDELLDCNHIDVTNDDIVTEFYNTMSNEKKYNLIVLQNGDGWFVKKSTKALEEFANSEIVDEDDSVWWDLVEDENGKMKRLNTFIKEDK